MSDPRAGLLIVAEDATAAAFNSANRNLVALESNARRSSGSLTGSFRNLGQAVLSVRNVLAGFGLVLSARALGNWIADTTRSTQVTQQQREAFVGARAALSDLNAELQERSLPLLAKFAELIERAADGWRMILAPTEEEAAVARMTELNTMVRVTTERIERLSRGNITGLGRQKEIDAAVRQLTEYREELDQLWEARKRQLGQEREQMGGAARIRREGLAGGFDIDDFIGQMNAEVAERAAKASADAVNKAFDIDDFLGEMNAAVAERENQRAAKDAEQEERRLELLAQHLDQVKLATLSEVEFEAETYARRQEILDQALEDKILSEQRHAQLSTELARKTEQDIAQIRQREAQRERQLQLSKLAATANLFSGLAAIAAAGGEKSKKNFELSKKLAIAEAIVNTYAAVTYALRNPPGPPFSFVQAAAAAAMGFAQVKAIQSTSWSGGGASVGGFGGGDGGGVSATLPNERLAGLLSGEGSGGRNQMIVNVNITTGVIGSVDPQAARLIADAVRHEVENNDVVIITRESRNGLTIRGDGVENE